MTIRINLPLALIKLNMYPYNSWEQTKTKSVLKAPRFLRRSIFYPCFYVFLSFKVKQNKRKLHMLGSLQRNFEWKRTKLCFNKSHVPPTSCEWKKDAVHGRKPRMRRAFSPTKKNAERLRRNSRAWRRQWKTQNANYRIFPQLQGLYKLYVPWLDVEKIPNRSIDTQIHPFILHDEGSLWQDLFSVFCHQPRTSACQSLWLAFLGFNWLVIFLLSCENRRGLELRNPKITRCFFKQKMNYIVDSICYSLKVI